MPNRRLRIIGGEWRSRQIEFPLLPDLRPTPDRVRETLFNWLRGDVHGASCLELFAGSGILSLEALSRGAKHCVALDLEPAAVRTLKTTLDTLGADAHQYKCETTDARQWIKHYTAEPFDLIFLDPPFADEGVTELIGEASSHRILAPNGQIYAETPTALEPSTLPANIKIDRQKKAGAVHYALLSRR